MPAANNTSATKTPLNFFHATPVDATTGKRPTAKTLYPTKQRLAELVAQCCKLNGIEITEENKSKYNALLFGIIDLVVNKQDYQGFNFSINFDNILAYFEKFYTANEKRIGRTAVSQLFGQKLEKELKRYLQEEYKIQLKTTNDNNFGL